MTTAWGVSTSPHGGRSRSARRVRAPRAVEPGAHFCVRTPVAAGAFARVNALVIGGSRGLGAAASKILALGGAKVALTFRSGRGRRRRRGRRNRRDPDAVPDSAVRPEPRRVFLAGSRSPTANAVFMFATPRIRQGTPKALDRTLFATYFEAYVEKLWQLCSFIEALRRDKKVVYVPSSTFVEAGSKGFLEYAMAKSAAEALAADVNASFRHVRVLSTRLPQLKTDQTASRFEVGYGSTFDTLYGVLNTVAAKV